MRIYDVDDVKIIEKYRDEILGRNGYVHDPEIDNDNISFALRKELLSQSGIGKDYEDDLKEIQHLLVDYKGIEALEKLKQSPELFDYVEDHLYPDDTYWQEQYDDAKENLNAMLQAYFDKEQSHELLVINGRSYDKYEINDADDLLDTIRNGINSDCNITIDVTPDNIMDIKVYDHDAWGGSPITAIPYERAYDVLLQPEYADVVENMQHYYPDFLDDMKYEYDVRKGMEYCENIINNGCDNDILKNFVAEMDKNLPYDISYYYDNSEPLHLAVAHAALKISDKYNLHNEDLRNFLFENNMFVIPNDDLSVMCASADNFQKMAGKMVYLKNVNLDNISNEKEKKYIKTWQSAFTKQSFPDFNSVTELIDKTFQRYSINRHFGDVDLKFAKKALEKNPNQKASIVSIIDKYSPIVYFDASMFSDVPHFVYDGDYAKKVVKSIQKELGVAK